MRPFSSFFRPKWQRNFQSLKMQANVAFLPVFQLSNVKIFWNMWTQPFKVSKNYHRNQNYSFSEKLNSNACVSKSLDYDCISIGANLLLVVSQWIIPWVTKKFLLSPRSAKNSKFRSREPWFNTIWWYSISRTIEKQ